MEVHPPHHPLHSWRDFFVHIVTITIGLLIAIGLEQSVEALHHRHLRIETRDNVRHELTENRATLAKDVERLNAERKMLEDDLNVLRRLGAHQAVPPDSVHFDWQWNSMEDSAWRTAHETSAVALFPIDRIQEYSDTYAQQGIVNEAGIAVGTAMTRAAIPMRIQPALNALSPGQIDELLHGCAAALNQIDYARDLARSLDSDYAEILKSF